MTIEEKIMVLEAYREGKTLEIKEKTTPGTPDSNWVTSLCEPSNFADFDYRIKLQPEIYYAMQRVDIKLILDISHDEDRIEHAVYAHNQSGALKQVKKIKLQVID